MSPHQHLRGVARDAARVNTATGTRAVATRVCLTVLAPMLTLYALDRMEWGVYAVFGAFAAIYGGATPFHGRWRMQGVAAFVLVGSASLGTLVALSEYRHLIAVVAAAVVGSAAAWLSDEQRWVPPGPLFAVFALGACSSFPTSVTDLIAALGFGAGTAALALALGRWEEARADIAREEAHGRSLLDFDPARRRLHVVRVAVAIFVAGSLATIVAMSADLQHAHPYWAMVAAVVPLTVPRLRHQAVRAAQRLVGTVAGIALAGLLLVLDLPRLALIAVVVALQAAAEMLVVRNYALALVFITPLALLMGQFAVHTPTAALLADRLLETIGGLVVGLMVAWLTRRRPASTSTAAVRG